MHQQFIVEQGIMSKNIIKVLLSYPSSTLYKHSQFQKLSFYSFSIYNISTIKPLQYLKNLKQSVISTEKINNLILSEHQISTKFLVIVVNKVRRLLSANL